jgi:nicotinate-nucleotide pyrophosphorylase (carboxylating)
MLGSMAIICGIEYAQNAFLSLDKNIQIEWQLNDGDRMDKNQILCMISGASRAGIFVWQT